MQLSDPWVEGDSAEILLSLQDEWRAASVNASFYETFCSTGQHAFNASRGTCTVTFSSSERRSKHWAMRVVVHREYEPMVLLRAGQDEAGTGDPGTPEPSGLLEIGHGASFLELPHLSGMGEAQ